MLVLVVEPGKVPESRDISGDLKEMQDIVGGYIEAFVGSNGRILCVPFPAEVTM